ncbi:MAG: hypothetical protein K8H89_10685, partial [Flavobacteriales bacterium]|nr:hypothetical protein [Flavobacteriales bacterium]
MRTRRLCAGMIVWVSCVQAQQPFENIYYSTSGYQMNLTELNSGNLMTAFAWYPGVSLLDRDGNFIQSKCFYGDSVLTMGSIRKYSDNEVYFVTSYRKDSCTAMGSITVPYTHPAIGRMDSLGNILEFRHYALNAACGNSPGDLELTSAKDILVWGRDNRFFAFKVDSAGAPVWAKRFSNNGSFRFIKELPGGDLLAGFDMDTAGASVARLDAFGNFIWCKSYMRPMGRVHDAVVESDSSFIITGYTGSTPYKLFMMKLDGGGEVQWCRGYDAINGWSTLHRSRIETTLDGNFVFLATLAQAQYPYFFRPFLMKSDLNGDTLWTRSVGSDSYAYYTRDLLASSDGGFLFSGIVWGNLPEMNTGLPYIFKADSLGHFSCQDQAHPVQVLDLFPTDSSFVLTSVDGATVHPAFVNDTLFDPIAVYDACIVTSVPAPLQSKARRVSIRPNPTTGSFTVEFTDPLAAD